jgi:hypothetical protein
VISTFACDIAYPSRPTALRRRLPTFASDIT